VSTAHSGNSLFFLSRASHGSGFVCVCVSHTHTSRAIRLDDVHDLLSAHWALVHFGAARPANGNVAALEQHSVDLGCVLCVSGSGQT
jgi:hypothetical protein